MRAIVASVALPQDGADHQAQDLTDGAPSEAVERGGDGHRVGAGASVVMDTPEGYLCYRCAGTSIDITQFFNPLGRMPSAQVVMGSKPTPRSA